MQTKLVVDNLNYMTSEYSVSCHALNYEIYETIRQIQPTLFSFAYQLIQLLIKNYFTLHHFFFFEFNFNSILMHFIALSSH